MHFTLLIICQISKNVSIFMFFPNKHDILILLYYHYCDYELCIYVLLLLFICIHTYDIIYTTYMTIDIICTYKKNTTHI